MSRLIRLDRTGHTELASWTADDAASQRGGGRGLPPRARPGDAGERDAARRIGRGRARAAARRRAGRDAAPDRRGLSLEASAVPPGVLAEAAAMPWRRRASERSLRREGRIWTLWSVGIVVTFGLPAALLVWIEPLAAPVVGDLPRPRDRGAPPAGAPRRPRREADRVGHGPRPERTALGLLGDLLGHERAGSASSRTGLALQQGRLGTWLVGQEGAILVRPGGRRVHCFCVRVGEAGDLPAGDRVAHLLLALREDEEGFATVANRNFSGAAWRLRAGAARPGHGPRQAARRPGDASRRAASPPPPGCSLTFSSSCSMTAGSRSVVTSPSSRPSPMSRSSRRMILPERVFGRSPAQMIRFGPGDLRDPVGDVVADLLLRSRPSPRGRPRG